MRTTPREDEGWRLRPPKLDRQPSLFVWTYLAVWKAAAAPRERGHKKYGPIPPGIGMDTVRLCLPYAALQGIYAKSSDFMYLLLHVLDTLYLPSSSNRPS